MKRKLIMAILPSINGGGAERVIVNLLNNLDKDIFDCVLVTCCHGENYKSQLNSNITLIQLNKSNSYKAIFMIINCIKRFNPDVILSAMTHINCITVIACKISGYKGKIIISEHNTYTLNVMKEQHRLKRQALKFLIVPLYNKSSKIVFVSEGVKVDFYRNFKRIKSDLSNVIYNPVVTPEIDKLSQEEANLNKDYDYIIAVGRLNIQKGFDTLLKVFKVISSALPSYRLLILGQGEELNNLKELACKLSLTEKVEFLGFQDNPYKYMAASKVFVLSSRWEGFGNVIVEAMACGTPVVSFDCPNGPAEIIHDYEDGILVSNQDINHMADSIKKIIINTELHEHIRRNAKIRANDFTVEKIIKQYQDMINEVLGVI